MRMKKAIAAFALAFALLLTMPEVAFACTGVIVGSDLTEDGSTIFGRTEDLETNHNKAYVIHEAGEYKKDSTIKDVSYDEENGYSYTFTHDSYRFTGVHDTTPEYGIFDEAGFNEKGLMVDMTVSADANEAVLEKDPLMDPSGISEAIMPTVVLAQCDTPENAIRFIATEVAKKGSVEGNGFVVANKDELWYMEIYTGHQFLAMRYPKDKFSVFPNTFWINEVTLEKGEENENYIVSKDNQYIYSKDLFKIAKEAGTFKGDEAKGIIDASGSYAEAEAGARNASRAASGIKVLNPNATVSVEDTHFPFLQEAEKGSITLQQVIDFTRNRFENMGNLATNDTGEEGYYPIGNRNVMEAHIFQVPKDATDTFPGVQYTALGSTLVSPFVPYYLNQTDGAKAAMNVSNEYTPDSLYWTAMDVLHMVETNREKYQPIVDAKRSALQADILKDVTFTDKGAAENTAISTKWADKSHEMLLAVQKELKADLLKNGYTSSSERVRKSPDVKLPGSDVYLTVPANTTDAVWKVRIDVKNHDLSIVDAYGNPVKIPEGVKLTISMKKEAFEALKPTFNGKTVDAKLKNEKLYVFDVVGSVDNVVRYGGADRYAVAVEAAKANFAESKTILLVNGLASGDALSASNVSQGTMPILYTKADKLAKVTADYLAQAKPEKVIIVGGPASVTPAVEQEIKTLSANTQVERIGGANRYAVNAKTLAGYKDYTNAVITSGDAFADALMAVPYAKSVNAPVLMVKKDSVPNETKASLTAAKNLKTLTIIGGPGTVTDATKLALEGVTRLNAKRVSGKDRFALSAEVAKLFNEPKQVMIANGLVPSDALTSGPLSQRDQLPILLVRTKGFDAGVQSYLKDTRSLEKAILVGGPASISEESAKSIADWIK